MEYKEITKQETNNFTNHTKVASIQSDCRKKFCFTYLSRDNLLRTAAFCTLAGA